jgi:hypothetical protein
VKYGLFKLALSRRQLPAGSLRNLQINTTIIVRSILMIYKDEKLVRREYTPLFSESNMIREYNEKINSIVGNHRDVDNEFSKKLIEFEKNKIIRKALQDILEIKMNVYNIVGIKL